MLNGKTSDLIVSTMEVELGSFLVLSEGLHGLVVQFKVLDSLQLKVKV